MDDEAKVLHLVRTAQLLAFQGNGVRAREIYREAGGKLYRLYKDDLIRLAWSTLHSSNKHLAEDIAQEVGFKAFESLQRFDVNRGVKLKTWLVGIFYHCRVDALKRYHRQKGPGYLALKAETEKQSSLSNLKEERLVENGIFRKRMDKLSDRERIILTLNIAGYKSNEIASLTRLSPDNVRKIIERATKNLKVEKSCRAERQVHQNVIQ